jgi:hypothetical protein
MNSNELFNVFVTKRANAGDKFAQKHLKEEKITQLLLKIESLGMAMQMEFSRIQGTSLHQIKTKEAGKHLKAIINDGLNDILQDYSQMEKVNYTYLKHDQLENMHALGDKALIIFENLKLLNLYHNFDQIVNRIKAVPYEDIIRILKILIITSIFRRSERRKLLPRK